MTYQVWIHGKHAKSLLLHPMRGALVTGMLAHEGPWTAEEAARLGAETYDRLRFEVRNGELHVFSPRA